jgi:hypothetical protein
MLFDIACYGPQTGEVRYKILLDSLHCPAREGPDGKRDQDINGGYAEQEALEADRSSYFLGCVRQDSISLV